MIGVVLLLSSVLSGPESCTAVDGDRIEMRHLRTYLQAGVEIPDDAVFSASPLPGVRRTVNAGELVRWAKARGAENPQARGACFEWPTRQLTESEVIGAMRASLEDSVDVKLVEVSRFPVPQGQVTFERSGLREPGLILDNQSTIWFGYVQYSHNRKIPIWGKVILTVVTSRVTVASALKAGEPISAEKISQEKIKTFPYLRRKNLSLADFVGRVARRSVRAGAVLTEFDVMPAADVKKGDVVEVEARFGHGVLRTQAVAEGSAQVGERLLLRNPESGKVMQAKVVGGGKAVVIQGLMPVRTKGTSK